MFDDFLESYKTLEESGIGNSLFETLRLFDLLSSGALSAANLSAQGQEKMDLKSFTEKRKQGMPWEYILGRANFMGQSFFCTQDTLIPTEETRVLVNSAVDMIMRSEDSGNDLILIEIGTGCGNIAISLALRSRYTKILAADISPAAVEIAKKNVSKFNLEDRIALFSGDLFAPFQNTEYAEKVDFVVCNPPYIPTGSLNKLPSEIIDYEPMVALDGGPYGIDFYRRFIAESLSVLKPEGHLFFEIGERQERLVARLLKKNGGYQDIKYFMDNEKVRAFRAQKKGAE